jgi:DNA-binding MarR family transcriptional regulator
VAPDERARVANLLGALALDVAHAQEDAASAVVGQSGAATAALVVVAASPGRTIEQLRGPLGLSQPGATRLFERLAADGLIDRGGSGGRRGLQIRLTDSGRRLLDEMLAARRTALASFIEPLDPTELAQLTGLLERLLAARTTSRSALERLCRLCERAVCRQCPVGHALDLRLAAEGGA